MSAALDPGRWLPAPAEPPPAARSGWITATQCGSPDADLIALCDCIVAVVAMEAALRPHFRAATEAGYRRLASPVDQAWAAIDAGLATVRPPATLAGARAAARAALELEPEPRREPCTLAGALARMACEFLAGRPGPLNGPI